MTGIFRLLFYILIGYIFYKSYKVIVNMFRNSSNRNSETNIFDKENVKSKINKKEVIDAEFEDINDKDNPPTDK
ncbi:MAG: hypothetical protein IPM32_11770 [Ignavibacteriae bacterium]|nr:hypothetical protein [Ignavibacteriota bacterium]